MVKARTLYVLIGAEHLCILRGYAPEGDEEKNIKAKHKGIFSRFSYLLKNIDETYIGKPLKLFVKNKIMPGWEVIPIYLDFKTERYNEPSWYPQIASKYKAALNKAEDWRNKYFEERRKNLSRELKDKMQEQIEKDFKFYGKLKRHVMPYDAGYGYPTYGYGRYTTPPTTEERNE